MGNVEFRELLHDDDGFALATDADLPRIGS
jgi:hypothetical protein